MLCWGCGSHKLVSVGKPSPLLIPAWYCLYDPRSRCGNSVPHCAHVQCDFGLSHIQSHISPQTSTPAVGGRGWGSGLHNRTSRRVPIAFSLKSLGWADTPWAVLLQNIIYKHHHQLHHLLQSSSSTPIIIINLHQSSTPVNVLPRAAPNPTAPYQHL